MLKFLFPTDFSLTANNAFLYALQFCHYLNAELYVLHTQSNQLSSGIVSPQMFDDAQNASLGSLDFYENKVPQMQQWAQRLELTDVPLHFLLEEGLLLQTIERVIAKENIDLLIMGTTGDSGFANKIFGSNTMAAINHVAVPVLSVPHLAQFRPIKNVCFTHVFKEKDQKILQQLAEVAQAYDVHVKGLYVNTSDQESQIDTELKAQWKADCARENVSFYTVLAPSVVEAVSEFIEQAAIDLMCNVHKNRSFFERLFQTSTTQQLTYQTHIPLLVFNQ